MTKKQLENYLKQLENATFTPGSGFTVQTENGARVFTAEQLRAEIENVNAQIDEMTPGIGDALGAVGSAILDRPTAQEEQQSSLEAGLQKRAKSVDKVINDYNSAVSSRETIALEVAGLKPSGAKKTQKDLDKAENKVKAAEQNLNRVGLFVEADGSIVSRTAETGQETTVSRPPSAVTGTTGSVVQNPMTGTTVAAGLGKMPAAPRGGNIGGNVPGSGVQNAANPKEWVDREIVNRGVADTPANRKRLRDEFKKMSASGDDAWLDTFRSDYPAYAAWASGEIVSYFGQDFIDVIREISRTDVEYSKDEKERLIRGTAYYQSTTNNQQTFDKSRPAVQQQLVQDAIDTIRSTYGDVNFSESDLQTLGRTVARNKLTGVGLQQEVFRTAFRSQAPTQQTQTQALTGAQADQIQAIARAYGRSATNDEIQAILTNQPTTDGRMLTSEGFRQQLQMEAMAAFPQLQEQLQAGLTLQQIGSRYRAYAADLLEQDPEQIDMFKGPFLDAFGTKETGPLSLGEWTQKVKSDSRFGWQYTNQANQQATDIALTLVRAFGKVQ